MTDKLTFWLGRDAEKVWTRHITKEREKAEAIQAEADRMRSLAEAIDE